jgi:hypothetical protein
MDKSRKVVLFPVDQFYAIVGTFTMPVDPYRLTLTDICNDMTSATHGARDHLHRPGTVFLTSVEFYSLRDNTQKVCQTLDIIHMAVKNIRGIVDFHPELFEGNPIKRQEYVERKPQPGSVSFPLHDHVLHGVADEYEIYRLSDIYRFTDKFIGLSGLRIEETPATEDRSLPDFLARIGCRHPDYMAVNLANVFHS